MRAIDSPYAMRFDLHHRWRRTAWILLCTLVVVLVVLPVPVGAALYVGPPPPMPFSTALRGCSIDELDPTNPAVCPEIFREAGQHLLPSPAVVADHAAKRAFAPLAAPSPWRPWEDAPVPNLYDFLDTVGVAPAGRIDWKPLGATDLQRALASDDPEVAQHARFLQRRDGDLEAWHREAIGRIEAERRHAMESAFLALQRDLENDRYRWRNRRMVWVLGMTSLGIGLGLLVGLPLVLWTLRRTRPLTVELTLHTLKIGDRVVPVASIRGVRWEADIDIELDHGEEVRIRAGYDVTLEERRILRSAIDTLLARNEEAEERSEAQERLRSLAEAKVSGT